ncbi:MAG: acyltransferase [Spirochaetia bacterium]|nr:acyltransferase [Spirochaetia bacterium]
MGYYNELELRKFGWKSIGRNVMISTRASIYNHEQIEIDDNSRIDDFCLLSGKLKIGKNVFIGAFCNLAGGEKGIILEDLSCLSYNVQVFSQSDDYSGRTMTNPTVPDKYKKEYKKIVVIEKHSIVGAGSIIFPGVTLKQGTSVGAMSLIKRNTKPWSIYSGNPAKFIRYKKKDILKLEEVFLKEQQDKK